MKCEKSGNHTISYQSLLLSTTVLNDIIISYCNFPEQLEKASSGAVLREVKTLCYVN